MRNKKLLSFTAGIILILIALPGISSADNAESLKAQIDLISGLTAEIVEPNVVQVSGNHMYEPDSSPLSLNIDDGVTVNWCAKYDGSASPVISYAGLGTFKVGAGGNIHQTGNGNTIDASGRMVIITGADSTNIGLVTAGNGSAIHATGEDTIVMVQKFGSVGPGLFADSYPLIFMNNSANNGDNVFVSGRVFSIDSLSTIQSYGRVFMDDGELTNMADNGHVINIIGNGSAEISGGKILALGMNTDAISTAAADPQAVDRAEVIITGGEIITSGGGHAIRTTGNNSSIVINGGRISATTGNAIRAEGDNSTINITNGFVFAYGTDVDGPDNVIYTSGGDRWTIANPGIVTAWNRPGDRDPPYSYFEGYNTDLVTSGGTAVWYKYDDTLGSISYANSDNLGVFLTGISDNVTVGSDFGLIFDAGSGKMYFDVSENGTIGSNPEYVAGKGTTWTGTTNSLHLNNFS